MKQKSLLFSFFLLFLSGAFQSVAAETQESEFRSLLARLLAIPGVSGHENRVLHELKNLLPEGVKATVDQGNNLLVKLGRGNKKLLFIAHMDEIGLQVDRIQDDGTLAVSRRGGFYNSIWESRIVKVHTTTASIDGIIPPRPTYLNRNPDAFNQRNLVVDVGTSTKEETESLGVRPGDFITQEKAPTNLGPYKIAAGATDDRAGCAAQLLALRQLLKVEDSLDREIIFAWCVEEEIGLNGARFISGSLNPDAVFAVDTFVSSDAPRDAKYFAHAPLGSGAVIRAFDSSNLAPRWAYSRALKIAKRNNIPAQLNMTIGGNDGSVFLSGGAVDLPLSWPGIYSHSYISVLDIRDINSLVKLIVAVAREF